MRITSNYAVLAIYPSHAEADAASEELRLTNFDMNQLFIVAHNWRADQQAVGYYSAGDRVKRWGKVGACWGLLLGSTLFFYLDDAPLRLTGPVLGGILGALSTAVVLGGLGALVAGLYSLGVPQDSILKYEKVPNPGRFVLVAHGGDAAVAHARKIISSTNPLTLEDRQPACVIMEPLGEPQPMCAVPEESALAA